MKTETEQDGTETQFLPNRTEEEQRTQHTPGPWNVSEIEPEAAEAASYALTLVVETEEAHIAFCFNDSPANARLIATAPELLEALEQCESALAAFLSLHPAGPMARAAIAKAKGRS